MFPYRSSIINGLLILLPILFFFLFVYKYAINVPYLDDMDLIHTINDLQEKPGDPVEILVRQQNDHRILFPRLGMIAVYIFTGEINFRYATLLGFVNLLLLAYAFFLIYKKYRQDLTGYAPIVILLFSPLVYFVHLSSLPAYQHSLSVAFSILCLYFIQQDKQKYWYWSIPIAFASTLSILDGLSILPIALTWLLIQKRFKHALVFGSFSFLWLVTYFYDFTLSSSSKLELSPEAIQDMFYGFVTFAGSVSRIVSDEYSVPLSFASGIVLLSLAAFLVLNQLASSRWHIRFSNLSLARLELLDLCFLRMLASGAMIAIGRSAMGMEVMTAVRYQVFSLSILILFYLFLVRSLGSSYRRPFLIVALSVSMAGNLYAYFKYDHKARELVEGLKADTYNFTHNQVFLHQYLNLPDPETRFYKNYDFPTFFDSSLIASWQKKSGVLPDSLRLSAQEKGNTGFYSDYLYHVLELKIQHVPALVPDENVYLTLQSLRDSSENYVVSVSESSNALFDVDYSTENRTFYGQIPLKLPLDTYEIRLCWIRNNTSGSMLISSDFVL